MIGKEFVDRILELKKEPVVTVDGRKYNVRNDNSMSPIREGVISQVETSTLTSIIDYLEKSPDDIENLFIHIHSERTVNLMTPLKEYYNTRDFVIISQYEEPKRTLNNFQPLDKFIVMLASTFQMNNDLNTLIALLSKVTDMASKTYSDDGVTQNVNIKAGITMEGEQKLPPIVNLIPFRTFPEVEQPESQFLLRAMKGREGVEYALYEADGRAWKNKAIQNIKVWFEKELKAKGLKNIILS